MPTLHYYGIHPLWCAGLPLAGALYLLMTWTSAWRCWTGAGAALEAAQLCRPVRRRTMIVNVCTGSCSLRAPGPTHCYALALVLSVLLSGAGVCAGEMDAPGRIVDEFHKKLLHVMQQLR